MNSKQKVFANSRITRVLACAVAAMLVVTMTISRVEAASGDLDPSFGTGGVVTADLNENASNYEEAAAVALQKDGRIIVGVNHITQAGAGDFVLIRYNTDGTLDGSFGVGGVAKTDFYGNGGVVNSVKIDGKGRIVAAGFINSSPFTAYWDMAMARYTAGGVLDTTFGSHGKFTRDISPYESIEEIAIQPDGKIVAAGWSILVSQGTDYDYVIFRLTTNGAPDPAFAFGNTIFTDFNGLPDFAYALALQADGRIVVGGEAISSPDHDQSDLGLARYNANGTLDVTFGWQGKVTTNISGDAAEYGAFCFELLTRPVPLSTSGEEQIIAVGSTYSPSGGPYFGGITTSSSGAMVCYLPDGSVNQLFGAGGIVLTGFSSRDTATCAVRQADGKLVIAGQSYSQALGFQFALMRYNGNGTLDTGFGTGGIVRTQVGSYSKINDLALTPQGGILAAGHSNTLNAEIVAAKYLP